MSILVQIQQEPAIINGQVVEIGEFARIPNATYVGWKKRGRCIEASPQAYLDEHAQRKAKRVAQDEEISRRHKGNKRNR